MIGSRPLRLGLVACILTSGAACSEGPDGPPRGATTGPAPVALPPSTPSSDVPVAPPRETARDPVIAGSMVSIPAGTHRMGSRPGTPGRRPRLEADLVSTAHPAFQIDRLPFPNDPARPPRVGATRGEAEASCRAEGKRLCTELEWERACLGTGPGPYTTGVAFDASRCAEAPLACGSDEGVLGMGSMVEEWTASPVSRGLGNAERTAVVRGAALTGVDHRCAARDSANPAEASEDRGFRCCLGPENSLPYPDEPARPRLADRPLDDAEARRILARVPEVARFADGFRQFTPEQALATLARGGKTLADLQGWEVMQGALRWAPEVGEEIWVIAGTDGQSSLLVAVYPMPDGSFLHGASFVLEGETSPIAVAHTLGSPTELLWSSCWGCGGEGGAVTYREDSTLVITQR